MPKNLINKQKNFVPVNDIYSTKKYSYYTTKEQFEKNSLNVIENTEDELHESVKNMFDLQSEKIENREIFLDLNKKFKKIPFRRKLYDGNKLLPLANFSSAYIKKYI